MVRAGIEGPAGGEAMTEQVPRTVFISGVLGFIGGALAKRFRSMGAEVKGVDAEANGEDGVVSGDITRPGPWQGHVAGCDVVVHTAAVVSNTIPRDRTWEVNVLGTRRVLDAAVRAGASRFVHFSSVRAYSDRDFPDGVDEDWPVRPDGHRYVDTKVASEQVVLQAHAAGEIPVTVIRPGDAYGPASRPWTVIPVEAISAGYFLLPDGGRGIFSPVYIDNLVDGVALAASNPGAAGQVFNITDGIGVPNSEFFGHYYRMLGKKPGGTSTAPAALARVLFAVVGVIDRARGKPTEGTAEAVDYFLRTGTYSIEKARRVLGYEPRVGLEEGMRRTEAWLKGEGLV